MKTREDPELAATSKPGHAGHRLSCVARIAIGAHRSLRDSGVAGLACGGCGGSAGSCFPEDMCAAVEHVWSMCGHVWSMCAAVAGKLTSHPCRGVLFLVCTSS